MVFKPPVKPEVFTHKNRSVSVTMRHFDDL